MQTLHEVFHGTKIDIDARFALANPTFLQEVFRKITLEINVGLLAHSNPSLSLRRLTPDATLTLRDLLVPWYERKGNPVLKQPADWQRQLFPNLIDDFPGPGDHTLSMGEVANSADPVHPSFKPDSIREDPCPIGYYPAYKVGDDKLLVLDGNHRFISVIRANKPYCIDLVVINGPVRRDIMRDLAVFEEAQG